MRIKKSTRLGILIGFALFFHWECVLAQMETAPQSRASYWAIGGENLVEFKEEIPFLEQGALFKLIKDGKRVMFIDTREPPEYAKSHLPNAVNVPFSKREEFFDAMEAVSDTIIIPYCNWDFRAYVCGLDMKKRGLQNVYIMYPHGIKGWMASGFPVAGQEPAKNDQRAHEELLKVLDKPLHYDDAVNFGNRTTKQVRQIDMRILKKKVEPRHIDASIGDKLILNLIAEEEDHWFVIPDFGVNVKLRPGETKTIELNLKRSGYFPYGCISCCMRYQCQVKQAILVDLKDDLSVYGE